MSNYIKNEIITGTVTGIEPYGIFVSLEDDYSGLVHISEISDAYVRNINDYVELDEIIRVKILAIDNESHHLKLSIKNFDYRINKKNSTNIKETSLGFSTLHKNMNIWIEKKKKELQELEYNYEK